MRRGTITRCRCSPALPEKTHAGRGASSLNGEPVFIFLKLCLGVVLDTQTCDQIQFGL
ncbi:UNVERIFIED_ORG: hypothetical protein EOZ59_3681 [Serratia quinivorans]